MKNMDDIIKNADEMFEKYNFTESDKKAYQKLVGHSLLWMLGLGAVYGIMIYKSIRDYKEADRTLNKQINADMFKIKESLSTHAQTLTDKQTVIDKEENVQ